MVLSLADRCLQKRTVPLSTIPTRIAALTHACVRLFIPSTSAIVFTKYFSTSFKLVIYRLL
jgi:hypothetical protein